VSLQTAWRRGRRIIEEECAFTSDVLQLLENNPKSSIFSPSGIFLISAPLESDDIDESLENLTAGGLGHGTDSTAHIEPEGPTDTEARIDIEDALINLACESEDTVSGSLPISHTVVVNGVTMLKSKALTRYSKYQKEASSTDHLRRVQQVERYTQSATPLEISPTVSIQDEELVIEISDPIISVICVDSQVWLCIGEVNSLKLDGVSVDYISFEMLQEPTVIISYQILGLRPSTSDDDPTQTHDWRTCTTQEQSFMVPGRLVQSINPTMTTKDIRNIFYLLESTVLVAFSASIFQSLDDSDLKSIPKMAPTLDFPYREGSGNVPQL